VGGDEGDFFTNKECTNILATFVGPRLNKEGSLSATNHSIILFRRRLTSSSRVDEPMRGADMSAICRILYFMELKLARGQHKTGMIVVHLRASLSATGQAQKHDS
jgi:hypothetical protein